jgi:hypothetical protein
MLEEILDEYENGLIEPNSIARKCYMTELHKSKNHITWVHDDELKGHSLLRKMGKQQTRDLVRSIGGKV